MKENFKRAAEIIKNSKNLIALTGAGHSVASGIPDFRGKDGLWSKYDPMVYAHIDTFIQDPEKVWKMLSEMQKLTGSAKPNQAHYALAKLEQAGLLKAVITQNVDNLHQEAGNKAVIEFHGNDKHLECLKCGSNYDMSDFKPDEIPPHCKKCNSILKPTVVLFGEEIPEHALSESMHLASIADAVLVIATSAQVYPAAGIPYTAKQNGAKIIEMNMEKTPLTTSITDVYLDGRVENSLPELVSYILDAR